MKTQASTVVIVMAVGAFVVATADALRASPISRSVRLQADQVRLKPDTPRAAYADGAAPGFSGGFGESSCDACHFDAAVNTPPGQVTLTGIPERFTPGTAYPITVTLSRPGMMIGGFQLAARFEKGGAQAGTLAAGPGEEKRIKIESGQIQYANQRLAGTALTGPGSVKWAVVWTAPPATGAVVFHVAANAANNDEAARGDYVFTAVATSQPQ